MGCERKESGQPAAGTSSEAAKSAGQQPVVYTTFYPTTYFAQRIGGDSVKVVCPCPADADPAFWMPDEKTVAAYQRADLIIVNGASFEKGRAKVTLPESRIVETAKPLTDELIVLEEAVTHTHGPEGEHSHEGIDGHTWLDPINARIQAGEIRNALVERFPDHAEEFEQGYAGLVRDLDALDVRLKALAGKLGDQVLLSVPIVDSRLVFSDRVRVPLAPSVGTIGVAPDGKAVPTNLAGHHGGNMDCSEVRPGAVVHLPVSAPGALLGLCDLHGAQPDGELLPGVECTGRVTLDTRIRKKAWLPTTIVEALDHIQCIGSGANVLEAADDALAGMIALLTRQLGLSFLESAQLVGTQADIRVCQLSNAVINMRASMPKAAVPGLEL